MWFLDTLQAGAERAGCAVADATSAHSCRFSGKRTHRLTATRRRCHLHSDGVKTCLRSCKNYAENMRVLYQHQNITSTQARGIGATSHRPQIERAAPVVPPPRPRVRLAPILSSTSSMELSVCLDVCLSVCVAHTAAAAGLTPSEWSLQDFCTILLV